MNRGVSSLRETVRQTAHARAATAVFGVGEDLGRRTILGDIQALALQAAAHSLKGRA